VGGRHAIILVMAYKAIWYVCLSSQLGMRNVTYLLPRVKVNYIYICHVIKILVHWTSKRQTPMTDELLITSSDECARSGRQDATESNALCGAL